jgi:hypothetical protein
MPAGFNLPPGITVAETSFAYRMFYLCTSLTAVSDVFNLPQGFISVESPNFCTYMFSNNANLVFNDVFQLVDAQALGATIGYYEQAFEGITAAQNRTAASIIGDVPTPVFNSYAFRNATGFSDLDLLPSTWR